MAISNLASFKGLVNINMQVVMYLKESITKIIKKVKEYIYGKMEGFMMVSGITIKKMGKVK